MVRWSAMGSALGSRWDRRRLALALLVIAGSLGGALGVEAWTRGAPAGPPAVGHNHPWLEAVRVVDLGDGRQLIVTALLVPGAAGDAEAILDALAPSMGTAEGDSTVTAQFALLRKWAKPFLPLPIWYNPADEPPGLDLAPHIEVAAATWNAVEGQYFRFDYRGLTDRRLEGDVFACSPSNPNVYDGQNVLSWARLPDGVLGVTCVLRATGEPFDNRPGRMCRTLDDVCAVIEADIRFNVDVDWSTAEATPEGMWDLRSTLLHELGHMLGLDHSSVGDPVMSARLPPGKQRRELQPDDIAGVIALYEGELFEHTIVVPGVAAD
jgi:hypothetical protein